MIENGKHKCKLANPTILQREVALDEAVTAALETPAFHKSIFADIDNK